MRSHDRFDELTFGAVLKVEVQTFTSRTARIHLAPKADVKLGIARKALEIVEDDHVVIIWIRVEISQQPLHAGAVHKITAPAYVVREDFLDNIALSVGVFAATRFLSVKAMSTADLRGAGDAAVDQGSLCRAHGSILSFKSSLSGSS
ncbi:MAG: hypothetical protein AAF650_11615 [Pseudomonadota bacterium]